MKYTEKVLIDAPREEVLKVMRSREDAMKWMEGLKSFELIEGEMDQENSKYEMVFDNKGKEQKMKETILKMNPPGEIVTLYEMGGVWNECVNRFTETGDRTIYEMDVTFKFPLLMSLFTWALKGMFRKETLKGMVALKDYIEKK